MDIDLFDDLTLDRGAETEHTVSCRVLRSDIDHILFFVEELVIAHLQLTILEFDLGGFVLRFLIGSGDRVEFGICVIIFAQRIAFPVVTQEEATHIGVSGEADTEIVEHFTFVQVGRMPQIRNGRQYRVFPISGLLTQHHFVTQHS